MHQLIFKVFPFAIIVLALTATAQITVTTAPPPTSNHLLDFQNCTNKTLVMTERIQNIELLALNQSGLPQTLFTLNSFDRTSIGYNDTYTLKLNGTWNYIMSSPFTLSCNLVFENTSNLVGLLRFDYENRQFKLLGYLPISIFTTQTDISLITYQMSYIFIGEDCQVGSFLDMLSYNLTLYAPANNWTTIQPISTPINYRLVQAITKDLKYAIINNTLCRFNPNSQGFEALMNLPIYDSYTLNNTGNRILLTGNNGTYFNFSTISNYTIYILNDVGTIAVVGKIDLINIILAGAILPIKISPQFTKLGIVYQQSGNQMQVIVKHVDYNSNTLVDLTFQDPVQYIQTVVGINQDDQLDFSDAFIVVRNGSKQSQNTSAPCFELAYQFVGNQVTLLNKRSLTSNKELYDFVKTKIDSSNTDKLVVLNLYNTSATSYELDQFPYGNIVSNRQINFPANPPYASFVQPNSTTILLTSDVLQWVFTLLDGTNTTITVVQIDNTTSSHTSTSSYSVAGTFTIKFQSASCQVIQNNANSSLLINKYNQTTQSFIQDGDASSIISAGATIINLKASITCDRLAFNGQVFYKINSSSYQPVANTPGFEPAGLDDNLTLAITTGGQIWKYDATTNSYSSIYAIPNEIDLPATKTIYSKDNKVIITARNDTLLKILAFALLPNNNFFTCLNYTFLGNTSQIKVSPQLSKVLVLAPNGTDFTSDLFFIDYQNTRNQSVEFPREAVLYLNNTYVFLDDNFIYIRQMQEVGLTANYQQSIFYFAQDILLKPVLTNVYPLDTTASTWVRSIIVTATQNNSFLMTEFVDLTSTPLKRVVKAQEINPQTAEFNSNSNAPCQSQVVNGQVKFCPRGCTNCDCTTCTSGFAYDSSSKTCLACAPGCIACDPTLLTKCTSCYPGYFINSTESCQPCESPCLTCNTSPTSCTKCPPGQFFNTGLTQCDSCPSYCFNCTNSTACITCQPGFVLNTNLYKCRKCSIKCSSCAASNITQCTSCAQGLQLVNGDCTPCPDKCLSCNSGQCAQCVAGYNVNSNGVCVLECNLPCVTCAQNQPTQCLSCQTGSVLSGSTCIIDSSCNSNHSCTSCGQGLNYYLMPTTSGTGADCLACPTIPYCLQCSSDNTYKCSICEAGYYMNQTSDCASCLSSCVSCVSSKACTGCVSGYTLLDGYAQGECLQCLSPCATCQGSPNYCTSCIVGFTKKNWMCQNNTYITLTFIINTNASDFLSKIDDIISGLLQILQQTDINVITLNSISSGSIVPTLSISPTSTSLSAAANALSTGLLDGIPGTSYTVSGVQVTQNGVSTSSQSQQSGPNIGLIVGLTVGLTVLGVAIVVTIILVRRAKAATQVLNEVQFNSTQIKQDVSITEFENPSIELKETIDMNLCLSNKN